MEEISFGTSQHLARKDLEREFMSWVDNKSHVVLELPTGVGKTYLSLTSINHGYRGGRILALFPEVNLIESFKKDCVKLGFGHLLENMDTACYASIGNYTDKEYEACIMDECHWCVSDLRTYHAEDIKSDRFILLSATLSEDDKSILNSVFPDIKRFYISASDAVERGLLPEPEIRIVSQSLDDTIPRNKYSFGKTSKVLTDKAYYKALSDSVSYWKDRFENEGDSIFKNKMLQAGNRRMTFLSNCKTAIAKKIIGEFDGRYIVFCGSLGQAKNLNGKQLVSSHKSKKDNLDLVEQFNKGETNCLFAKNMLREGVNLTNCKYGLVVQLSNKERNFVQMLGRILRHDDPVLYLIKMEDTIDDRLFFENLKNIKNKYIYYEQRTD